MLNTNPVDKGITYYTEKAFSKAKELIDNNNHLSLCAQGDAKADIYTGDINLRIAIHPGQEDSNGLVYAFTDKKTADIVLNQSKQYGNDDSLLVITFDELYSHAMQCEGVLIDAPTYGLELYKKDFGEVLKWREVNGIIVINLNNN